MLDHPRGLLQAVGSAAVADSGALVEGFLSLQQGQSKAGRRGGQQGRPGPGSAPYGRAAGPFVEMGVGMDVGEAFVGNIGERALYDFTAVGDVVNTASRLQGQAAGGEIILSENVATGLSEPVGSREELTVKGKSERQVAYRVAA